MILYWKLFAIRPLKNQFVRIRIFKNCKNFFFRFLILFKLIPANMTAIRKFFILYDSLIIYKNVLYVDQLKIFHKESLLFYQLLLLCCFQPQAVINCKDSSFFKARKQEIPIICHNYYVIFLISEKLNVNEASEHK